MNLVLLFDQQFINSDTAKLTHRQQQHLSKVLKSQHNDTISVGKINGKIGKGRLNTTTTPWQVSIVSLNIVPPPRLPLSLILALPRPQMIKRILQTVATMGVETLHLIQTSKVEKSFWQSPSVTPDAIQEQFVLGLEQGADTVLPNIHMHKRFRPFIEDDLPAITQNKHSWIAHPGMPTAAPRSNNKTDKVITIGPEGGFSEKEVELFVNAGFSGFHLGKRILKVETAVPVILAKFFDN